MADSRVIKPLLHDNPLCGISTYKDTLNLATGACTRQIKKLVLTGKEDWQNNFGTSLFGTLISNAIITGISALSTHYTYNPIQSGLNNGLPNGEFALQTSSPPTALYIKDESYTTVEDWKAYLAQQYANGTPVCVWYVLATPTTETVTVPTGLSGTEEGYLTQSSTPTPTNPVYPTANEVLIWLHSLRKLTTATDTFTTLPVNIYTDGTNATVGLVGNMQQTGTPSPSNPVDVNGVGMRTENLWSENYSGISENLTYVPIYVGNGQFTLSTSTPLAGSAANVFILAGNVSSGASTTNNGAWDGVSRTATAIDGYVTICYRNATANPEIYETMLNSGSTAKPYEPYGYKIPISSANTTTPVYLGEVETTRQIKKLVFNGTENWLSASSDASKHYISEVSPDYMRAENAITYICSHYSAYPQTSSATSVPNLYISMAYSATAQRIYIADANYTTNESFIQYLQEQYAAGTPVTVWYVLATETTGIVNEPIRKIGSYADTVSGITIPTIAGKDTVDVETTLKPSEVSLSYTGWHDATVKEWDGSQWQ